MSIVMELDKEYRRLMNWMVRHSDETLRARKDFYEKVVRKRCFYGDTPFQMTCMPLFLKAKSLRLLRETTEMMDTLVDRVIRLYFEDPFVHDYFPYWHIPKEWIEADPGYIKPTIFNRLDVLYDGKSLKFIEFNTDNPGGVGWTDIFEDLYRDHALYRDFISQYGTPADRSIVTGFYNAVKQCFSEMGFTGEPLRLALASFRDIPGGQPEAEIIRDFFIRKGIEANIIDARDFELRENRLWASGIKYTVIMRNLRAEYFMRYPRYLRDFISGVTNRGAALINSFRSFIGSHKTVLSFLSNPLNNQYFSEKERKYIKKYIPWTRRLDEIVTLSKEGDEIDLKRYILAKREEFVLKPSMGAGGYNVMVGKGTTELKWNEAVEQHLGDPSWIVQEYTEIPRVKIPVVKNNKIVLEEKYFNLSPYCIGGKYLGVLGRVSDKEVINISAGGGIIPVFPLRESYGETPDNLHD